MNLVKFISDGLYLTEGEARRYIATIPRRYKRYSIDKRNSSEKRLIAQPAKQVKSIQRSVLNYIRGDIKVHESAFAYEKNKDIRKNAELHSSNEFLLKMDFKNFFMSINPTNFLYVLEQQGIVLDTDDIFVIENLFFWKYRRSSPLRLSIGAPSSPFISNAVMYDFDINISKVCYNLGVTYSRYADDLTFSTNKKNVLFSIPKLVRTSLNQENLRNIKINKEKTVFSSKKFNRHVTGVTLTNLGSLSIGRDRKRLLRSKIDYFIKGELPSEDILTLKGELGYAYFIEPIFIERMIMKYGADVIDAIRKYVG